MGSNSNDPISKLAGEDPLGIDKLSVDYDYLLYKINDYVQSMQLQVTEMCTKENKLISDDILTGLVDKNIKRLNDLLQKCDELENHFDMLDQIEMITATFKDRLSQISVDYKKIRATNK